MNAVEIEEALSALAIESFDGGEFPFAFLMAFGNKDATIRRLRKGDSNASDVPGGVLQRNNIHIATCAPGDVHTTLQALRASPKSQTAKPKFLLATDGQTLEAEDLASGEVLACEFEQFADHFGFFLPLAGISTVKEIKDNPVDVRATGRLNKLYVELLQNNKDWAGEERRADMNHFMARLVFCFFAEDTDIFQGTSLFTRTLEQMSERDGSLRTGELNWKQINPDIFGSMIQAVADEDERGALGMHYTSVPNILKVLNPLFLDDLRGQLEAAGDNKAKLLNLRKRMARIRIFDPACGSGNFLVIAYKQMREIEADINRRRGESDLRTEIPLTNFRGIELREFPAEIARLALIIAEFQCDVLYRGQKEALAGVLPLDSQNWITTGNALRLDWFALCPPAGVGVDIYDDSLFGVSADQSRIVFENEGGETYICGNPPYLGNTWQTPEQKSELRDIAKGRTTSVGFLDYVAGWFLKASDYLSRNGGSVAFVSTNSICQGQSVPILWPIIFEAGCDISFAYTSFKWENLASHNAGVVVVIVGMSAGMSAPRRLYEHQDGGPVVVREGASITPYLTVGPRVIVEKQGTPMCGQATMEFGNKPSDGGYLLLSPNELAAMALTGKQRETLIRRIHGSQDFISGSPRFCIWIDDENLDEALKVPALSSRIEAVRQLRLASPDKGARTILAKRPHQLKLMRIGKSRTIVVPGVSSERRDYLPVGIVDGRTTLTNLAFGMYDAPVWNMALVASRLHLVWIATVCGKMKSDFRYSNTMGWNTFPVPSLTEQNKTDLTRCAEDILIERERYFPATIGELYESGGMPESLRIAHERNDEVLERIYIGRRFKNDTERLEKLFDLYTKMTAAQGKPKKGATRK